MQLPAIAEFSLRIAVLIIGALTALGYMWAFGVLSESERGLGLVQIAVFLVGGLLSREWLKNGVLWGGLMCLALIGLGYAVYGLFNVLTSPFGLSVGPHLFQSLASLFVVYYVYSCKPNRAKPSRAKPGQTTIKDK